MQASVAPLLLLGEGNIHVGLARLTLAEERANTTAPARAPQTDRYVGPGWGIDDLPKRYSRLNLVALRPHYDLVTLMDHMGSSLDRLEVDQRGRTFPPRAPRRLAATPNRTVSCLHTSIAPLPFVIGHF